MSGPFQHQYPVILYAKYKYGEVAEHIGQERQL